MISSTQGDGWSFCPNIKAPAPFTGQALGCKGDPFLPVSISSSHLIRAGSGSVWQGWVAPTLCAVALRRSGLRPDGLGRASAPRTRVSAPTGKRPHTILKSCEVGRAGESPGMAGERAGGGVEERVGSRTCDFGQIKLLGKA